MCDDEKYFGSGEPIKVAVDDFAIGRVDGDAVDDVLPASLLGQREALDVAGEDGPHLLSIPSGSRAHFGDAHAEAIDAAVLVVHVQVKSVWFALIATRSSHQILLTEKINPSDSED